MCVFEDDLAPLTRLQPGAIELEIVDLPLNSMRQSAALHHIFSDQPVLPPIQKVAPGQDLDLPEPNDEHLDRLDLGLHRVQAFRRVCRLPLLELRQEELHGCQKFHQRGGLTTEATDDVVGQENALVEEGTLVLISDHNVSEPDHQVLDGRVDSSRLFRILVMVEIVGGIQLDL